MSDMNITPEKNIGGIIAEANNLTAAQLEEILQYQRENGVKFGEAAVALGFISRDVLWALSQQFHYPYSAEGSASAYSELVVANKPFDAPAEFFRDIRSNLIDSLFSQTESRCALAVCSADPGDGKSFFSANLAVAFSQLGRRTLLIDADMRTPRQSEIFKIEGSGGALSSVLAGRMETNVIKPVSALPNLYLLPVGVIPPNPLELVQSTAFDFLIAELLRKFDYVIVDTPAASHGADARVIAAKCGASVVIARRGVNRTEKVKSLVSALNKRNHRFAGVILNAHK